MIYGTKDISTSGLACIASGLWLVRERKTKGLAGNAGYFRLSSNICH